MIRRLSQHATAVLLAVGVVAPTGASATGREEGTLVWYSNARRLVTEDYRIHHHPDRQAIDVRISWRNAAPADSAALALPAPQAKRLWWERAAHRDSLVVGPLGGVRAPETAPVAWDTLVVPRAVGRLLWSPEYGVFALADLVADLLGGAACTASGDGSVQWSALVEGRDGAKLRLERADQDSLAIHGARLWTALFRVFAVDGPEPRHGPWHLLLNEDCRPIAAFSWRARLGAVAEHFMPALEDLAARALAADHRRLYAAVRRASSSGELDEVRAAAAAKFDGGGRWNALARSEVEAWLARAAARLSAPDG